MEPVLLESAFTAYLKESTMEILVGQRLKKNKRYFSCPGGKPEFVDGDISQDGLSTARREWIEEVEIEFPEKSLTEIVNVSGNNRFTYITVILCLVEEEMVDDTYKSKEPDVMGDFIWKKINDKSIIKPIRDALQQSSYIKTLDPPSLSEDIKHKRFRRSTSSVDRAPKHKSTGHERNSAKEIDCLLDKMNSMTVKIPRVQKEDTGNPDDSDCDMKSTTAVEKKTEKNRKKKSELKKKLIRPASSLDWSKTVKW